MSNASDKPLRARAIAFYLPQFHPIPENDEWWGPGFTEWTNVAKARPLFRGHVQPKLPADLGFYDLRLSEVREKQSALACSAGIEAFCYWHYWFGNGRRILERPFAEVLASGQPAIKFCLAWANQSWSGIWHGSPDKVLIKQVYPGVDDEVAHFKLVLPAFKDSRYVCVDGKPVFALLDPSDHPRSREFVLHWRRLAEQAGLPGIYFVAMWNKGESDKVAEFDAVMPYGPGDFLAGQKNRLSARFQRYRAGDFGRLTRYVPKLLIKPRRFSFSDVVNAAFSDRSHREKHIIPTVLSGWDNTPRSGGRGIVFEGMTPALFEAYMRKAITFVQDKPAEQKLLFIKAWNEWAEGNYLEPDTLNGHSYLDAVRRSLTGDDQPI